jgi:hypothetical protein
MGVVFKAVTLGDDRVIHLVAKDEDANLIDLTGASLRMVVTNAQSRANVLDSRSGDATPYIALGTTPLEGEYKITLQDGVTATWSTGTHHVEVKAQLSDGSIITLLREGELPVIGSEILSDVV